MSTLIRKMAIRQCEWANPKLLTLFSPNNLAKYKSVIFPTDGMGSCQYGDVELVQVLPITNDMNLGKSCIISGYPISYNFL